MTFLVTSRHNDQVTCLTDRKIQMDLYHWKYATYCHSSSSSTLDIDHMNQDQSHYRCKQVQH